MFGFFRRPRNQKLVEMLHDAVMAGARQPAFYARLGVPDTLEGRFEMAAVHAYLLVRRLNAAASPGPELARDVTDTLFARFDVALRETGTGDLVVPKKIKKMAQNYLGRVQAYTPGLEAGSADELAAALARNVYGQEALDGAPHAPELARYMLDAAASLTGIPDSDICQKGPDWPLVRI